MSVNPLSVAKATSFPVLTAQQMAEVDDIMVDELGVTLLQMLENAGRSLADLSRRLLGGSLVGKSVAVLVGPGGNGAGGLAAARHMANAGAHARLFVSADASRLNPAAAHQLSTLKAMGVESGSISDLEAGHHDLAVDALLGYGARGAPRGRVAELIRQVNRSATPVLALDVPTGLDPDTGALSEPHIRALATLTIAAPKVGLLSPASRWAIGDLYVADISVPAFIFERLGFDVRGPLFEREPMLELI
jgi:NAD(P)H-hydrate epimerase